MTILLKNFDCQLLVDKIVLCEQMLKVMLFGTETGLTVLDSRAGMRAEERSWPVMGVVT